MQHAVPCVRRPSPQRSQLASAGAKSTRNLGDVLVYRPDAPTAHVEVQRVGAAVDDSHRTRGCRVEPGAESWWRADACYVT